MFDPEMLLQSHLLAAAAAANPSSGSAVLIGILPWLLIFLIFYVLMIRPQNKRMKEHRASLAAIKKGDEVVTGGGIRGKVVKAGDDELEVEIAQGVRVRVLRGTISQVLTAGAKPAND
jgi:preprotein translocase subunit YajC